MKIYLKLVYLEIFHLLDDLGRHHWQSCTHNQNSIQTLVPPHPLNNNIINIYGIKLYSCTSGMSGNVPGGGKAKLIPPNLISPGLLLSSSFTLKLKEIVKEITLKLSTWAYILLLLLSAYLSFLCCGCWKPKRPVIMLTILIMKIHSYQALIIVISSTSVRNFLFISLFLVFVIDATKMSEWLHLSFAWLLLLKGNSISTR